MTALFGGWHPPSPRQEPEPPSAARTLNYEQVFKLNEIDKLLVRCEAELAARRAAKA